MRHWPFSVIKDSPLMPDRFAWEMYRFPTTGQMSPGAYDACVRVAMDTRPRETGAALIISLDAGERRVYLEPPSAEDWLSLERGAVVWHDEQHAIFFDVLH